MPKSNARQFYTKHTITIFVFYESTSINYKVTPS